MPPDLSEMAKSLNWFIFDNSINLDQVTIEYRDNLPDSIWGLTLGFENVKTLERTSIIFIRPFGDIMAVLTHELVHAFQIQMKQKVNHNGAFMRYYEKKAREIGIEIDMRRY